MVMMLLAVAVGMVRFQEVEQHNARFVEQDWVSAAAAHVISSTVRANARRTMELLIVTDVAQLAQIKERIKDNKKAVVRPPRPKKSKT